MNRTIAVTRISDAVVVHHQAADPEPARIAAAVPPESGRTAVVVGPSARDAFTDLDPDVVASLREQVTGDVRVLIDGFGSAGPSDPVPRARVLAERLGVDVVAADGPVVPLVDGSRFVPPPATGWLAFAPDGARRRLGLRHPAPWWEVFLPDLIANPPPIAVTEIPVGLWLRAADQPDRPDPVLRTRAADPRQLTVVVGAPGEPAPDLEHVAGVLCALPPGARDHSLLVDYGQTGIAEPLATRIGTPVRLLHGIPDAGRALHVDSSGSPTWHPFAVETVYPPGGPALLQRWTTPTSTLRSIGIGVYRLAENWCLRVVPRGLVAHPDGAVTDPDWLAPTGPTADLVISADGDIPDLVVAALDELIDLLPSDARCRLRIVATGDRAAPAAEFLSRFVDRDAVPVISTVVEQRPAAGPDVAPPVVVTLDGRILPRPDGRQGRQFRDADAVPAGLPTLVPSIGSDELSVPALRDRTHRPNGPERWPPPRHPQSQGRSESRGAPQGQPAPPPRPAPLPIMSAVLTAPPEQRRRARARHGSGYETVLQS